MSPLLFLKRNIITEKYIINNHGLHSVDSAHGLQQSNRFQNSRASLSLTTLITNRAGPCSASIITTAGLMLLTTTLTNDPVTINSQGSPRKVNNKTKMPRFFLN